MYVQKYLKTTALECRMMSKRGGTGTIHSTIAKEGSRWHSPLCVSLPLSCSFPHRDFWSGFRSLGPPKAPDLLSILCCVFHSGFISLEPWPLRAGIKSFNSFFLKTPCAFIMNIGTFFFDCPSCVLEIFPSFGSRLDANPVSHDKTRTLQMVPLLTPHSNRHHL